VLAKAAVDDRNEAYVVRSALLRREESQLAVRRGTAAKLASVRGRIAKLEAAQAAAARAAQQAASATQQAPTTFSGSGGDVVARVVAAANQIASTPYVWGGGHGSFQSGGYDCSGSVSYALAGGGLLRAPMTSGAFMNWGAAGPGKWITIAANGGHMYMYVAGLRFDTSGRSGPRGSRWQSAPRSNAGFALRHPPGL
jgi:cell wall-associated NlpC family hydrolase